MNDAMAARTPARTTEHFHDVLRVHDDTARRVRRGVLGIGLWVIALIGLVGTVELVRSPSWPRGATVIALAALLAGLLASSRVKLRRQGLSVPRIEGLSVALLTGVFVGLVATGGLESPFLPALPLAAIPISYVRYRGIVCLAILLASAALAGLHVYAPPVLARTIFGLSGPTGHTPLFYVMHASLLGLLSVSVAFSGVHITRAFQRFFERAADARDESLRLHAEHVEALTRTAAEIAHEINNPLAAVKGLCAVVARHVEGDRAELLEELRAETNEAQRVLAELLDFSRPLGPLEQKSVRLGDLCADVVRLFERRAHSRGLRLVVVGDLGVSLACDPRKVRQIVIHLVRNAFDAKPATTISLELSSEEGFAFLAVGDDGEGVPPEIRGRELEPGVSGSPERAGFGLTMARSLARQHGGELSLDGGRDRGCTARLSLPLSPASGVLT